MKQSHSKRRSGTADDLAFLTFFSVKSETPTCLDALVKENTVSLAIVGNIAVTLRVSVK